MAVHYFSICTHNGTLANGNKDSNLRPISWWFHFDPYLFAARAAGKERRSVSVGLLLHVHARQDALRHHHQHHEEEEHDPDGVNTQSVHSESQGVIQRPLESRVETNQLGFLFMHGGYYCGWLRTP